MKQHRGFFAMEAVVGMALLAVLGAALLVALSTQQRIDGRMADRQAALAAAERTLLQLREGQGKPAPGGDATIEVREVQVQAQGRWVRVKARVNQDTSELIGLVAAPGQAGGQ